MKCEFRYDGDFMITALRRHRKQGAFRKVFYIFLGLFLAWIVYFAVDSGKYRAGSLPFLLLVALLFSSKIDDFLARRGMRKSPFNNNIVQVSFSEEGIKTKQDIAETALHWAAFTKVVEHKDGLLAYQGNRLFNWFPKSGFESTDQYDAVRALMKTKISKYGKC